MQNTIGEEAHAADGRAKFIGLDAEAVERLRRLQSTLDRALPRGLDALYGRIRVTTELRRHFRDETHIEHARSKQLEHWRVISTGRFDEAYYKSAHSIGLAHARIGLEPRWYVGGYAIMLEKVIECVVQDTGGTGFFSHRSSRDLAASLSALIKAVLLDMEVAISVYFEKIESERELLTEKLGAALKAIANSKDLTVRLEDVPPAYAQLQADFNTAISELEEAVRRVSGAVESIDSASSEIAAASSDLSRRTESQAASLEETTAALAEITSTVTETAESAHTSRDLVTAARKQAEASGDVAHRAIAAMESIETTSRQISEITGVIDEIAFQTNLLALNAGVEAARAGEAGRGFAVVASEVRALAQRSGEAAKQIRGLISTSRAQVETGVELVGDTRTALEQIIAEFANMTASVAQIASNAKEQADGLSQVNIAVNEMDQMTQQNAAMVEQTTAATQTLAGTAQELAAAIEVFRVSRKIHSHVRAGRPSASTSRTPSHRAKNSAPPTPGRGRSVPVASASGGTRCAVAAPVEAAAGWEEF